MKRRSTGELTGLIVAFVVGGAIVTFGILVIGSLLNLSHTLLWVAAIVGLVLISFPMVRSVTAASDDPQTPDARLHDQED